MNSNGRNARTDIICNPKSFTNRFSSLAGVFLQFSCRVCAFLVMYYELKQMLSLIYLRVRRCHSIVFPFVLMSRVRNMVPLVHLLSIQKINHSAKMSRVSCVGNTLHGNDFIPYMIVH